MMKDIEPVPKVSKVKLRLHKKLTMKGLYYRELIKRIENPKRKKISNKNVKTISNEGVTNNSCKEPLTGEGHLIDKLC